jgi:putative inorganic carbon (hco3(-)) transporter
MKRKAYPLSMAFGTLSGCLILAITQLPTKWIIVTGVASCFPILLLVTQSLTKALLFILILSLSMKMDFYLGYSEAYVHVKPGVPISLASIVVILAYAVWWVRIALKLDSVRFFPSVTVPFGLLVVWSGLSFLTASRADYVLSQIPGVVTAFLVFLYAGNMSKSQGVISLIIKSFVIAVALSGVVSIAQYAWGTSFNLMFLGGSETLLEHQYSNVTISRVSGLLRNANDLAFFLNGVLPLLLLCGIAIKGLNLRVFCVCSFTLGLMVLLVTYTRAGWLAFAFSLIIAGICSVKHKWLIQRVAVARIVIIGLITTVIIGLLASQIVTRLTQDDYGAAVARIPLAKKAIASIIEQPIMGVGLGNYWAVVSDHDPDPLLDQNNRPMDVHNMYLYIAAELGLPAFGLFAWLSILVFKDGITSIGLKDGQKGLFALGLLAGLAGIYLNGMFENISFGHPLFVFLAFLWGCLVGMKEK